MKKNRKSAGKVWICILLILAVVIGQTAFGKSNHYVYVSFGDSIAEGIGLPDSPLRGPDQPDKELVYCHKTEGAYPSLVAEALDIQDKNFYQLACAGMRTVELRACLDSSYEIPDQYANNFMEDELQTWVLDRYDVKALVRKADLITLTIGANDVASYALFYVREALNSQGIGDEAIDEVIGKLEACGDYSAALVKLLSFAKNAKKYAKAGEAAIKGLTVGYSRWTKNWDAIMKIIYQCNPDVTVVCTGMYNPFRRIKLSGTSQLEIGACLDGIVENLNAWVSCGSKYAERYIYADIMGIEAMFESTGKIVLDEEFIANFELNVHPSATGHRQVADAILSGLNSTEVPSPIATAAKKVYGAVLRKTSGVLNKVSKWIR